MSFYSLGFRFTNWFETSVHDIFRKKWTKNYSVEQFNDAKANFTEWKTLTKEQKREIAEFWGIKHPSEYDYYTHEIMLNVKGNFDVRYLPEKIHKVYLDPSQVKNRLTVSWEDKNYFDRYQPNLSLPYTFVRNVDGYLLDHDYHPIAKEEAKKIMLEKLPLIVKPSIESGEGKNLILVSDANGVEEVFAAYNKDYLAQEVVEQCDLFKRTNPYSVNVMRIVTAIVNGEAKLMSGMLLTNTTDVIACNKNKGPGEGVVCIGIDDEGKFLDTGYYENAKALTVLPNGLKFGGLEVPSYKEAVNLAVEAHNSMPMFGLVGWDITIDKDNRPLIIEWNLHANGIYHSQLTTGPLFGEYSDYFAEQAKEMMKQRKL